MMSLFFFSALRIGKSRLPVGLPGDGGIAAGAGGTLLALPRLAASRGDVPNSQFWAALSLSCAAVQPVRVWGSSY